MVRHSRACSRVDRDSGSKGLGFDRYSGHVYKCQANFSHPTTSVHSVIMGTRWNENAQIVAIGPSCAKGTKATVIELCSNTMYVIIVQSAELTGIYI